MGTARVGISGWDYDRWVGDFYPEELPRSRRLSYAAQRFACAEINGTFYGLLSADSYSRWHAATPRDFRFALKGSRFITHNKKLGDVAVPLANFFASGPLALRAKLGPVLWQLPARQRFDAARLQAFVDLLPNDTEAAAALAHRHDERVDAPFIEIDANHRVHHALEARDASFFCREAVRILRRANVALVVSHAGDWPLREELTAGFVYVRLHGEPDTYASGYDDKALRRWAERVAAWRSGEEPENAARITGRRPPRRKRRDVWVFFDNDAAGRAPHDAAALARRLHRHGSDR